MCLSVCLTVLAWTLYFLATHQQYQDKLVQKIKEVVVTTLLPLKFQLRSALEGTAPTGTSPTQRDCAFLTKGRGIISNYSSDYVSKNRTPHIDKRGKTCLILAQEVIYKDASNLYDKLTNNLATFSTPGMAILPSEELSSTPTDHNIFQLGKNKLAAQVTVFFTVVLIRTTACQTLP